VETRRYAALHHRRQARQLRIVNLQPPHKIQKHRKTKVLTDVKLVILRGKFAAAVQHFKIIRPRFDGVGQPDP
jgi:hypothetical protein